MTAAERVKRPSSRSSRLRAKATRKSAVSTSESDEVAADVPVQLLERDRGDGREEADVDERLRGGSRQRPQELGRLLDPRRARELVAPLLGEAHVRQALAARSGGASSSERLADGVDVVRRRRRCPRRSRGSGRRRRRPGGTAARIGRPAAMYSNTLPESTPLPRPPASGIRSSSASESRWSASEVERGAYGISSSRSPRPSSSAHSRSALRKSPRKRATDVEPRVVERLQERPRVALAEEAARVRDPEALAGRVVEPLEVVEVGAVRDRHDPPARLERPHLVGDEVGDARRSRRPCAPRASRRRGRPSPSRARRRSPSGGARGRRASRAGRRPSGRRSRA